MQSSQCIGLYEKKPQKQNYDNYFEHGPFFSTYTAIISEVYIISALTEGFHSGPTVILCFNELLQKVNNGE